MKKISFSFIALLMIFSCTMKDNPLLEITQEGYGQPPFDKIMLKHYKPAFEHAIIKAKKEIDSIAYNPEAPTFKNTIEALELAGEHVEWIAYIFFNLNEAETSDKMQRLAGDMSKLMTEFYLFASLHTDLF
ncbi:MAG: peptidase M3, partial [Bacteroidales bacterium]